jgi:anti-sigma B factor antagonist
VTEEFQPKPFNCEIAEENGAVHLRPAGDLDMSTATILGEALKDAIDGGAKQVVVDLRGLEFMDSTGITLVTRFNNESRRDGFNLALIPGKPRIMRLFELTGLSGYFTFTSG